MTEEEIIILLERYAKGLCTADEKRWVEASKSPCGNLTHPDNICGPYLLKKY